MQNGRTDLGSTDAVATTLATATLAAAAFASLAMPAALAAQDGGAEATEVVVRVVAHDAKLIGTGVGGARVTIRDASTGDVLAQGVHEGSSGSTERIMESAHARGDTVYATEGAAGFRATLELSGPTRVEITAEGPLGTPHAVQRATKTVLLVPGRDVTGEGVVLELYGFTVKMEAPPEDAPLSADDRVVVRARVEMLCGCPLTPGGTWDADRVDVRARLVRDGTVVQEAPLGYGGLPSVFSGRIQPPEPGSYELVVLAADAERGNFGLDRRSLTVGPAEE